MNRAGLYVAGLALLSVSCGGGNDTSPLAPSAGLDKAQREQTASGPSQGGVSAQNEAPIMVLRTQPPADESTEPYPTIQGPHALTVTFNLCDSRDPDQNPANPSAGDTLNWQFHFGDSGEPAFDEDGRFNADEARVCRTSHTYNQGVYTATVVVTDKHLEDQGADVIAAARVVQHLTIISGAPLTGAGSFSFESSDVPVGPMNCSPGGSPCTKVYTSTLKASGAGGSVTDLDVSLHILYTFDGDLVISVAGPDSTSVLLADRRGSAGDNYGNSCGDRTVFDDQAATPIGAFGSVPFAGSFIPESPLSAFNGKSGSDINGTWTLTVTDTFGDGGDGLQCWGIDLTTS